MSSDLDLSTQRRGPEDVHERPHLGPLPCWRARGWGDDTRTCQQRAMTQGHVSSEGWHRDMTAARDDTGTRQQREMTQGHDRREITQEHDSRER